MMMKTEQLNLVQEWDKTFPKSDKVDHSKVTFVNHFGITLAADMYVPKNAAGKLPAIAVSGPFGACKEQSSGLYAQEMAERGFLTVAFDPSFTGESGGFPRAMHSPDIDVEDFQAAVDFLSCCDLVDPDRIGIIGICGHGSFSFHSLFRSFRRFIYDFRVPRFALHTAAFLCFDSRGCLPFASGKRKQHAGHEYGNRFHAYLLQAPAMAAVFPPGPGLPLNTMIFISDIPQRSAGVYQRG